MNPQRNLAPIQLCRLLCIAVLIQGSLVAQVAAQITLSNTNTATENFDSMGSSPTAALPGGMKMSAAGQGTVASWESTSNVTAVNQQASSGTPTTGARYNWGSSATDRAAGFMTSGSFASPNAVMAKIVNNTGSTMTGLSVSFDVERYRVNTAAASVSFFTSLDGATWTASPSGDTGAFATNTSTYTFATGTVVSKNLLLPSLSVSNGGAVYLKWNFNTSGGNSQGLGLDNLVLQAVVPSADAPVITSAPTASAIGFTSFSYQITATRSPTSYNATGLPAGLSVDPATGLISGSPTEQGTFNATIFASNASGTGSGPLALTVSKNPGAPTITSPLEVSGVLNAPFSYQIIASNSPTTYSASNLQTGLTIDTATGLISGTPTAGGLRNVTITASNVLGTDTRTLVLFIGSSPVVGAPTTASAYTSAAVNWQVVATGPATAYSATGLPPGLAINTSTGLITGTASATAGTSTFQITATNPLGSDTKTFTLAVLDQAAQNAIPLNVVVNKYANSTPDQIQLLVVGNGTAGSTVDMRGMVIKDFSSNMASDGGGKYSFADNVLWAAVPSGSFITLSTGATAAEDFDLGDFYVAVNLDNATYFTNVGGAGAVMDIGTTEMIMIKAPGTGALGGAGGIHSMASGTAGAQFNAFLGAKLLGAGTTAAGTGAFANNASSVLSDYGASGAAAATGATGNTPLASLNFTSWNNASNQTYVLSLRANTPMPTITALPPSLAGLTATQGAPGPSTNFITSASNLSNNITVSANDPVNFAISTNDIAFTNTLTLSTNVSGGLSNTPVYVRLTGAAPFGLKSNTLTLSSGSISTNVIVSGTVVNPAAPAINPSTDAISGFTTQRGTASTIQTVTVTGTNLGGTNITVVSSNNFYEISTNALVTPFSNSLALAPTGGIVAVRISTNAPSTNSLVGNLALSGAGATNNVALNGVVTNPPPSLTVSTNSLPRFTATTNQVSSIQSFTAGGSNLSNNITVTAPAGFALSFVESPFAASNSLVLSNESGAATNRVLYVRMNAFSSVTNIPATDITLNTIGASGAVTISGSVTAASPSLTVTPPSLTNFSTVAGTASPAQSYALSGSNLGAVTVIAPAGFQVALTNTNAAFANSVAPVPSSGTLNTNVFVRVSAAAATNTNLVGVISNVSGTASTNVSLQARVVPAPKLSAVPTALSNFSTIVGIASTNQPFTLSANNLLGPVNLSVTNGYEISFATNTGFVTSLTVALTSASDVASNYTSATWTNGANQGSGFGPWALPGGNGGTGFSGAFIGPATNTLSNYAPLYTGGVAFSIYAGGSGSAFQDADRNLARPLAVGETLTHSFGIAFDNGNKGFDLYSGTNQVFNFNVNSSGYSWTGGNTAPPTPYPTNREFGAVINFSFTRTTNGFTYAISSPQDSNLTRSGSLTNGGIDRLKYYISGAGGGDPGNIYFNNFQVAYTGGNISNLPIYVRLATNAPVAEGTNSLLSRVTISSTAVPLSGVMAAALSQTYNAYNDFYLSPTAAGWIGATNPSTTGSAWGYYMGNVNGNGGFPLNVGSYLTSGQLYKLSSVGPLSSDATKYSTSLWDNTGGAGFARYLANIPGWSTSLGSFSTPWFDGAPGFGTSLSNVIWMQSSYLANTKPSPDGPAEGIASVLTWTAPVTGSYSFSGRFVAGNQPSNSAAVSIVDSSGGTNLPRTVLSNSSTQTINFTKSYNAGDTVQFQVGNNFSTGNAVGLQVNVAPATESSNVFAYVDLAGTVASKPLITYTTNLALFTAVRGFPSDAQQFEVGGKNLNEGVLVTPPANYQVSTNGTTWSNTVTVPRAGPITSNLPVYIRIGTNAPTGANNGEITLSSSGASNEVIPVLGNVLTNTGPQLTALPPALATFSTEVGANSAAQTFSLTGQGLTSVVALSAPAGFVLSTHGITFLPSSTIAPAASGFISNTISVRMTGVTEGVYNGSVSASSSGAAATVSVGGTVYVAGGQVAATPRSLGGFSTTFGTPSPAQSFLASARNLGSTNLVAAASAGYEVSTNSSNFFGGSVSVSPSSGSVDPLPLFVRLSSSAPVTNSFSGTVDLSAGSSPPVISISLTGSIAPLNPPVVQLLAPTSNPTIIAPGSTVRLRATATDTTVAGTPGTLATFQFLTNGVPIPGAVTNNVLSPATLQFDWTPALAGLPVSLSARAVDTDNLTNDSTSVLVRYTEPGEPVAGFIPPVAKPVNTQIEAVAPATNGAFYVGGNFTNFVRTLGGVSTTNVSTRVARILADGVVDPEFVTETGANNVVRVLLPSAMNKSLYIGGAFTSVSGVPRSALARLAVGRVGIIDGTLDAGFAPVLAGGSVVVNAIVEQYDGKVLVGGSFSSVNGVSSPNIARLNADGTVDTTFVAPAPSGAVNALALQPDGKILVGGAFTQMAGQSRRGVARLNLDGTLDTGFIVGTGVNGTVNSVAVAPDGSIYAGGQFGSYNGRTVYNNLVKLSSGGVLEGRFNYSIDSTGGLNGAVNSVQVRPTGEVLVCGLFTQISNSVLPVAPTAVGRIVQLKPDGSIDPDFNPGGTGANNTVRASATLANGNLVLVGAFSTYNGQSIPRILVLSGYNATTSVITSPWFLTVGAGEEFDFAFTSSGSAPYTFVSKLIPRGVKTNAAVGRVSGIALDSGGFDMSVASTSPTGGAGTPSLFRLYVVPQIVSYQTWKRVWFTPTEQTNPSVSGPAVSAGNPSGQPNFSVYALSGGNPRREGLSILPETATTYFEGQPYLGYTVWRYSLADAALSVETSENLQTWGTNAVTITNTSNYFQVRLPVPMSSTNRQFFRLKISAP